MEKQQVKLWDRWTFDGDLILDPYGNKWSQNDLNSALMGRQLYREIAGTTIRVRSLKMELEKRIEALSKPEITLIWNGEERIIQL